MPAFDYQPSDDSANGIDKSPDVVWELLKAGANNGKLDTISLRDPLSAQIAFLDIPNIFASSAPNADLFNGLKKEFPQLSEEKLAVIEQLRERNPRLDDETKRGTRLLQACMLSLPVDMLMKRKDAAEEQIKAATDLRDQLRLEFWAGVYGPVSQKTQEHLVFQLEKMLPKEFNALRSLGLSVTGSPFELELDNNGRAESRQLLDAKLSAKYGNDTNRFSLSIDTKSPPDVHGFYKLEKALNWHFDAGAAIQTAIEGKEYKRVSKRISEMQLPHGWAHKPGQDSQDWAQSAREMLNLMETTKDYIGAMHDLFKASQETDVPFPLKLPRNVSIVVQNGDQQHTLDADSVNDLRYRPILAKGTITNINFTDLPDDLRLSHPANKLKIEPLTDWLNDTGSNIADTCRRLRLGSDAVLFYGDQEVEGKKAVIANGTFTGRLVDSGYRPGDKETLKDVNLLGYDFRVEEIQEGEHKGKLQIVQTIEAEDASLLAYKNARVFSNHVGERFEYRHQPISKDGYVPIRVDDRVELIKASELQDFRKSRQRAYYGGAALGAIVDGAMTVSGTIEIAAALKAARLAVPAANAALKLSRWETVGQVGKGFVRVGLGGTGAIDSAAGKHLEIFGFSGKQIIEARDFAIAADAGRNTCRFALRLFRSPSEVLNGPAERVQALIHGAKADAHNPAINGWKFIRQVHTGTDYGFRVSEIGFMPFLTEDLGSAWKRYQNLKERDHATDAAEARNWLGDKNGLSPVKLGEFNRCDSNGLKHSQKVIDGYSQILCSGQPAEVQEKIKEIFARCRQVMEPSATQEERKRFIQQLSGNFGFTETEILELEKANKDYCHKPGRILIESDLENLQFPESRGFYEHKVREKAAEIMARKNPDLAVASMISILFVGRDETGMLPEKLCRLVYGIDTHKQVSPEHPNYKVPVALRWSRHLTSGEVVHQLRHSLNSTNGENRTLIAGDALYRMKVLRQEEFGQLIRDVLKNPACTRETKLNALFDRSGLRLAGVIEILQEAERLPGEDPAGPMNPASRLSNTYSDYRKLLKDVAKTDADADVRAAAGAMSFALDEPDHAKRTYYLSLINECVELGRSKPGEIGKQIQSLLIQQMTQTIPDNPDEALLVRQRRIDAAIAFGDMLHLQKPKSELVAGYQKQINESLLESAANFARIGPETKSVASKKLSLMTQALDALFPERWAEVEKSNPQLAKSFIKQALQSITAYGINSQEEELTAARFFRRAAALFRDRPECNQFFDNLIKVIDNQSGTSYASGLPLLKQATIELLSENGCQRAVSIIRTLTTPNSMLLKVGDKSFLTRDEESSTVRKQAILALADLKDPYLKEYLFPLLDKETDSEVAAILDRMKPNLIYPELNTREYKDIFDRTASRVIDPARIKKYDSIADPLAMGRVLEFINTKFPLVAQQNFQKKCAEAADDIRSVGKNKLANTREVSKAIEKLDQQRQVEFAKLLETSQLNDEDGLMAKMALHYMIEPDKDGVINEFFGGPNTRLDLKIEEGNFAKIDPALLIPCFNPNWTEKAAAQINVNCEYGNDHTIAEYTIYRACEHNSGYSSATIKHLLAGLKKLTERSGGASFSSDEVAHLLQHLLMENCTRLNREAQTLTNKSQNAQIEIIQMIHALKIRSAIPVIDAFSQHSKYEGVKNAARECVEDLLYSVSLMWKETEIDKSNPTPEQRAAKLRSISREAKNAEALIKEMFSSYKGYVIKDEKDPAIGMLIPLLKINNERVRLAAAKVLLTSDLPLNSKAIGLALETATEVALSTPIAKLRSEAITELSIYERFPAITKDRGYVAIVPAPITIETSQGKYLKIERTELGLKATVLREIPGKADKLTEVGFVYPNGDTFKMNHDLDGNLIETIPNGIRWTRKPAADGSYTNCWQGPAKLDSSISKGEYCIGKNGRYYFAYSDGAVFVRGEDGKPRYFSPGTAVALRLQQAAERHRDRHSNQAGRP